MGRRKIKNTGTSGEIKGIIFITLGVLMIISILSSASSGILGRMAKKALIALFGFGAYIFPMLIIMIGICIIAGRNKIAFNKKFYGILLFVINTMLLVQMITFSNYYVKGSIWSGFSKIYESDTIAHGGIISYIIDIPFYTLLGAIGSYVIFAAFYIISIMLIFKLSIYEIFVYIKSTKSESNEDITQKQPEKLKENNEEKSEFVKNINSRIKIMDFMKSQDRDQLNKNDTSEEDRNIKVNGYTPSNNIKNEIASDKDINEEIQKNLQEKGNDKFEYRYPEVDLLKSNSQCHLNKEDKKELINSANKLEETLSSFGVDAKVLEVSRGPSVTRFELQPSPGIKVSKIVNLSDDIALGLAASGVRIEAPIPGKSAIGIEVPNKELTSVFLREVIESVEFINSTKNISFCLGKDISGNCVVSDLTKMPHLLIAGATGSGKSVCINTLIISLLYKYSPQDVKLLMIDPKVVELNIYNGIPHLLIPVVTDPKKAAGALYWAVTEMTKRYKLFAENNVRNIEGYNELFEKEKIDSKLPFIVIIIDELADLMMVCPNDIEDYIGRLAQMARASGMHLVIATQRPSVDVITGVIKANIPSRISFSVSSQIDSRTILDMAGAEKLLGKGDMLFYPVGEAKPIRIQGAFISETEVEAVVDFIKNQWDTPLYKEEIINQIDSSTNKEANTDDELLDEAISIVIELGQASTSLLQRRLRIGYNRAARLIDQLEDKGIISGRDGSKPRQVLVNRE